MTVASVAALWTDAPAMCSCDATLEAIGGCLNCRMIRTTCLSLRSRGKQHVLTVRLEVLRVISNHLEGSSSLRATEWKQKRLEASQGRQRV